MSKLFSSLKIREVEFKNRIFVSPMCQYSGVNGKPTDWHFIHLGTRAVGGAGLVIAEATAVSPEGRITPDDLGIWDDKLMNEYSRITEFIKSRNSVPGIQLAHAGRKASTYSPWKGEGQISLENGGWQTLAPSAVRFADNFPLPLEMNPEEIKNLVSKFKDAAERSVEAGFKVIEIHMAHGYLIHQFLSPISNNRMDNYGGSFENRVRLAVDITKSVRGIMPSGLPLFVRISATDWVDGGWDIEQSVKLVRLLKECGVDLIDCSSGGNIKSAVIPAGTNYQIPFAERIRKEVNILTGGVGFITLPKQAEEIIESGRADAVLLARELLRNPYWPQQAAKVLGDNIDWPDQYLRAK
ncbi:MAG: oxidoreductase [Ignavibacteriae bacterium HGW-Ignavibacteriae-3]|nr:MAG: oxidoreductase [Ignavibacteriae bacterium HGW-Ignavibacteriae-3]